MEKYLIENNNKNNNNNNNNNNEDLIIKSVFKNIYLLKLIYKFVRLYNNNEIKEFWSKKQLLEYKEREYISNLIYNAPGVLEKGDLPINHGILKQVSLRNKLLELKDDEAIPNGIEIITFTTLSDSQDITFSKLPSTIHTVNNFVIKLSKSLLTKSINSNDSSGSVIIPPKNITSISFRYCFNIINGLNKHVIIPNTIKSLKLYTYYSNLEFKLLEGEIPNSVTSLHIPNYKSYNLKKGILPNTIKELTINFDIIYSNIKNDDDDNPFEFFPNNIESLSLILSHRLISPDLKLNNLKTIKKLELNGNKIGVKILPNSLPPNLEELIIIKCTSLNKMKIIPKTVKKLEISFIDNYPENRLIDNKNNKNIIPDQVTHLKINKLIKKTNILPSSLINLNLNFYPNKCNYTQSEFNKMISIIPTKQLNSITIPLIYKELVNNIPQSSSSLINKIKFI